MDNKDQCQAKVDTYVIHSESPALDPPKEDVLMRNNDKVQSQSQFKSAKGMPSPSVNFSAMPIIGSSRVSYKFRSSTTANNNLDRKRRWRSSKGDNVTNPNNFHILNEEIILDQITIPKEKIFSDVTPTKQKHQQKLDPSLINRITCGFSLQTPFSIHYF